MNSTLSSLEALNFLSLLFVLNCNNQGQAVEFLFGIGNATATMPSVENERITLLLVYLDRHQKPAFTGVVMLQSTEKSLVMGRLRRIYDSTATAGQRKAKPLN